MTSVSKKQNIQEDEYSLPYHYIPQKSPAFSQHLYWSWGINYLATIEFIIKELKKNKFNSLIDIGCGDGRLVRELSSAFPEKDTLGIDYSSRAINLARALNPKLNFEVVNIQKEKPPKKFDRVLLIEVLEHISPKQRKNFIKGIVDSMHQGGELLLTVPHKNMPLQKKHFQHFDLETLKSEMGEFFHISKVHFLGEQSWRYQLILLILRNPVFILNHVKLRNKIFDFYQKNIFLTNEKKCSRIYLKLTKK